MALVTVAKKGDIANGTMIGVVVEGKKLLIANVGGKLYSIDSVCSHMGGDLSKGRLESTVVTCPRHGSQYDVTNGKNLKGPNFIGKAASFGRGPHDQATFQVTVEGDDVKVNV